MAVTAYGNATAKESMMKARHAGEKANLNARQMREQKSSLQQKQSQSNGTRREF